MAKYSTWYLFSIAVHVCCQKLRQLKAEVSFSALPHVGWSAHYIVYESYRKADILKLFKGEITGDSGDCVVIKDSHSKKAVSVKVTTLKPFLEALNWSLEDLNRAVLEFIHKKEVVGVYNGSMFYGFELVEYFQLDDLLNEIDIKIQTVEIKSVEFQDTKYQPLVYINNIEADTITFKISSND